VESDEGFDIALAPLEFSVVSTAFAMARAAQ